MAVAHVEDLPATARSKAHLSSSPIPANRCILVKFRNKVNTLISRRMGRAAAKPILQTAALHGFGLMPLARAGWVSLMLYPSYMFRLFLNRTLVARATLRRKCAQMKRLI